MEEGRIVVQARARRSSEDREWLETRVIDAGIGLRAEDTERIFRLV